GCEQAFGPPSWISRVGRATPGSGLLPGAVVRRNCHTLVVRYGGRNRTGRGARSSERARTEPAGARREREGAREGERERKKGGGGERKRRREGGGGEARRHAHPGVRDGPRRYSHGPAGRAPLRRPARAPILGRHLLAPARRRRRDRAGGAGDGGEGGCRARGL